MDCRTSFAVVFVLTFGSGCVTTQPGQLPADPPMPVADKGKEPKRPPLPGTVVALAVISEREGDTTKDAAQQMKAYDTARQYYQDALRIDPKYRDAVQGLARVYTRMNDFDHALEVYRKALEKTPQDHGLWFDLGMCHSRKKDLAQALPCLQKALELDPENRQYMKWLGFTLARAGQTEQGLAQLTRAMGTALAHYNLARLLEHMGQRDACCQHLQLALQINPNLEQARDMLASVETRGPTPGVTLSLSFAE